MNDINRASEPAGNRPVQLRPKRSYQRKAAR